MPPGRPALPLLDRFWSHVDKSGDCWLWTASTAHAYGQIGDRGRNRLVHRLSWEIHFGPIPAGMWVLHRCDVPLCVRPDHLFLGRHADNMRDMTTKGRPSRGEDRPLAKLTEDAVREIRASGEKQAVLAARYGVTDGAIRQVLSGRTWKHVT